MAARQNKPAFSLIEMMIVVIIVGALLGLTLPLIHRSRVRASDAVSQSDLAGHARVFAAYTGDWKDAFPIFTRPGEVVSLSWGSDTVEVKYFDGWNLWNLALAPSYYANNPRSAAFSPPLGDGSSARDQTYPATGYGYACAYLASPNYWDLTSRETWARQAVGMRGANVTYPDRKTVLLNVSRWRRASLGDGGSIRDAVARSVEVAFVDGHAGFIEPERRVPEVPGGDGLGTPPHPVSVPPTMHTFRGVGGMDIR